MLAGGRVQDAEARYLALLDAAQGDVADQCRHEAATAVDHQHTTLAGGAHERLHVRVVGIAAHGHHRAAKARHATEVPQTRHGDADHVGMVVAEVAGVPVGHARTMPAALSQAPAAGCAVAAQPRA